jgi:MoaA/NifB/PqqE/SkfB family radical SAM enzyme
MLVHKLRVITEEIRAHRRAIQARNALEILILYVTTHCNMRCGHCFYADNLNDGTQDLSPERAEKIFKTLPAVREEIAITGGEPFLHRKLPALVRAVHDSPASRDMQINTNGFYTDRTVEYCRDITSWNRKRVSIQISLDGLEKTHDEIRGIPGSFQKAMATAEKLSSMARLEEPGFFTPVFLMVMNKRNYQEVRPLAEMIRREFGLCLAVELVRGTDFSAWGVPDELREPNYNPPEIALPPEEAWDSLYRDIRDLNREMGFPFRLFTARLKAQFQMLRTKKKIVDCVAPDGLTPVIYANGDVATCEFSRPFANLADFGDDFAALWESELSRRNQAGLRKCFCTHSCFLVPSMRHDLSSNLKLIVDL